VSIRVEREGTILKLVAKRLDGQAGYKIGDLIEAKERTLSDEESKEIFKSAGKLGLFEIPAKEREAPEINDGERWFLEGSQRGRFHRVERESANVDAEGRGLREFVKFCAFLESVSKREMM
jgi:hypothetical protein